MSGITLPSNTDVTRTVIEIAPFHEEKTQFTEQAPIPSALTAMQGAATATTQPASLANRVYPVSHSVGSPRILCIFSGLVFSLGLGLAITFEAGKLAVGLPFVGLGAAMVLCGCCCCPK